MVDRMERYASIQEAAGRLSISAQAVHKRIKSGTLDAVKLNGRWLVDESSIERALIDPPRKGRPWPGVSYVLMNGRYPVMEFTYRLETMTFKTGEVFDALRAPIGTVSGSGRGKNAALKDWWERRSIPKGREGMDSKLQRLGLRDPAQIPFRNLGLSLTNQYWICPVNETLRWEDINYFQHDFGSATDGWDEGLGVASACPCFVSSSEEYVPMSLVLDSERKRAGEPIYDAVVRACVNLGIQREKVERFLAKMIVTDSILANTDRHLRNFGLIRNIDDLSWRLAPLFDTGNSLWYDKDESAVARGDHSFVARPFEGVPNRQLSYASILDWLDISQFDDFPERACDILADGDLSRWRLDYLRTGIRHRLDVVKEFCDR